ncbi:hypothetical protein [Algoriphagus taiwanensis]|uniref:Uncharacterized protein n=1 Tax=Algoriphagus taiwanensis TaxID=1445656 RepID=A0ABQ6Q386_9BACT|nr:hypothetical protein Ataiwa_22870 [Algoriphagus taiwanensis]
MRFLKENAISIYKTLLWIVLMGHVADWFLDFTDETNRLLSTAMFCLIGIAYLTFAWAFDKIWLKTIFLFCGIYVILMNFIPDFGWIKTIIGIVCTLTPLIIQRFIPEEKEEVINS